MDDKNFARLCKFALVLGFVLVASIGSYMYIAPKYDVYSSEMSGKAEYARAEQNKQILVTQARAEREAEILRAEGTAQANKIIGDSLKQNDDYLRWMWLNKLDSNNQRTVIYVPTDGMIPNLETGRIGTDHSSGARK